MRERESLERERARERVGCRQEGDRHTETEKEMLLFCWLFVVVLYTIRIIKITKTRNPDNI